MSQPVKKQRKRFKYPHPADDLSFMSPRPRVGRRKGGIDYWLIEPAGDFGTDCDTGSAMAEEFLAYIGKHSNVGNTTLLTAIVHDMIKQAKDGAPWTGIHVGFLQKINEAAMVAAKHMTWGPAKDLRLDKEDAA